MPIDQALKDKIAAIGGAADAKISSEQGAIDRDTPRRDAIDAAIKKNVADRTNAEKAKVYGAHAEALLRIYEAMGEDSPHAPPLAAVISSLADDATNLSALAEDLIVS